MIDSNDKLAALLELLEYDRTISVSITTGISPVVMCLENVNIGDASHLLTVCGAGDDMTTALDNLYSRMTDLADDAYVVVQGQTSLIGLRYLDGSWVQLKKYHINRMPT